jgi:hypothetical protein
VNGVASNYDWVVDTTAPSITAKPPDPSTTTTASFSFNHTEGGYTFKCQIDGGGFSACASPKNYSSLSVGASHTFQVEGVDANGTATAAASYTWSITSATKLVFTTSAQTLLTGTTSGTITVQRQNASNTPVTADPSITVNLLTTSGGGVFRDTSDTTSITTVTIPSGSSSASFKYKDTTVGQPTITASAGALTSATQTETVNNSAVAGLIFSNVTVNGSSVAPSCAGTIGTTYTCTVSGGNNATVAGNVVFANSSGTPTIYSPASQTLNWTSTGKSSGSGTVSVSGNQTTSSTTVSAQKNGTNAAQVTVTFGSWTAVLKFN